jgi:hypothetical protein
MRPEPVRGCGAECTRGVASTKRGLWAMHAESGELIDQAYSTAPIGMGTPPMSPSAALVSTDTKETGLWLWQGEVLPSPSLPGPQSRDQQILRRVLPAAGWAGWIALPIGLALMSIAISMMPHSDRPDRPVSAETPAIAPSSPVVTRPIVPLGERTEAQLDQVQLPSTTPAVKITPQAPEPPVAKGRTQHKLSRPARKTQASHVRKRPLFPTPGVLTPPPMTWHGGGY